MIFNKSNKKVQRGKKRRYIHRHAKMHSMNPTPQMSNKSEQTERDVCEVFSAVQELCYVDRLS